MTAITTRKQLSPAWILFILTGLNLFNYLDRYVFSAVLTPQQFHESAAHFDFFRKHFATKGIEVAEACANTLHSLERLRGQVAAGIV